MDKIVQKPKEKNKQKKLHLTNQKSN